MATDAPKASTFQDFRDDFKRLAISMIALGAAPPILNLTLNVGPPWPSSTALSYFTTIALWVTMLWTYAVWVEHDKSQLKTRISVAATGTIIFFMIYILLTSMFVWPTDTPSNMEVIGWALDTNVEQLRGMGKSVRDQFRDNEFDPEKIWTQPSLGLIRASLVIAWLGAFSLLAALTAAFLLKTKKYEDRLN